MTTFPTQGRFGGSRRPMPPVPPAESPASAAGVSQPDLEPESDLTPAHDHAPEPEHTSEVGEPTAEQSPAADCLPADNTGPTGDDQDDNPAEEVESEEARTISYAKPDMGSRPKDPAKPRRANGENTRGRKKISPATGARTLIVVRDGRVETSDSDAVIIDLDVAAGENTDAAGVVNLIASLKPAADGDLRSQVLATLKDLVADKALA